MADTDPTPVIIMDEYPQWTVDPVRSTDGLCDAYLFSPVTLTVRGEDWMDLRDGIIRAQATLEHGAGKLIALAEERRRREAQRQEQRP